MDLIYQARTYDIELASLFDEKQMAEPETSPADLRVLQLHAEQQNEALMAADLPVLWCADNLRKVRAWHEIMPRCLWSMSRIDEGDLSDALYSPFGPRTESELFMQARSTLMYWQACLAAQLGERPRVFVASSREAQDPATVACELLGSRFECVLWDGFIKPGHTVIEGLEMAAGMHDFGLFVMHADDLRLYRGAFSSIPRDNVVLELGLFVGRSSRHNALIIVPDGVSVPTDLEGVVVTYYDPEPARLRGSLEVACDKIASAFEARLRSHLP